MDVCTMKIPAHGVYANVLSQSLRSMSLPLLHIDQAACTANDTYKITICQETKTGGISQCVPKRLTVRL